MLTRLGAQEILKRAMSQTKSLDFSMALVAGVFDNALTTQGIEPTIGIGGYQRQPLGWTAGDWPTTGYVDGHFYIESKPITFLSDSQFDLPITRCAIVGSLVDQITPVMILGTPLITPITIGSGTASSDRTFAIRIFANGGDGTPSPTPPGALLDESYQPLLAEDGSILTEG